MFAQAEKIIEKFGGAPRLAHLLKVDVSAVYKWTYPKTKGGTDGLIPSSSMRGVLKVADALGVELTSEDLDPREQE